MWRFFLHSHEYRETLIPCLSFILLLLSVIMSIISRHCRSKWFARLSSHIGGVDWMCRFLVASGGGSPTCHGQRSEAFTGLPSARDWDSSPAGRPNPVIVGGGRWWPLVVGNLHQTWIEWHGTEFPTSVYCHSAGWE